MKTLNEFLKEDKKVLKEAYSAEEYFKKYKALLVFLDQELLSSKNISRLNKLLGDLDVDNSYISDIFGNLQYRIMDYVGNSAVKTFGPLKKNGKLSASEEAEVGQKLSIQDLKWNRVSIKAVIRDL